MERRGHASAVVLLPRPFPEIQLPVNLPSSNRYLPRHHAAVLHKLPLQSAPAMLLHRGEKYRAFQLCPPVPHGQRKQVLMLFSSMVYRASFFLPFRFIFIYTGSGCIQGIKFRIKQYAMQIQTETIGNQFPFGNNCTGFPKQRRTFCRYNNSNTTNR